MGYRRYGRKLGANTSIIGEMTDNACYSAPGVDRCVIWRQSGLSYMHGHTVIHKGRLTDGHTERGMRFATQNRAQPHCHAHITGRPLHTSAARLQITSRPRISIAISAAAAALAAAPLRERDRRRAGRNLGRPARIRNKDDCRRRHDDRCRSCRQLDQ